MGTAPCFPQGQTAFVSLMHAQRQKAFIGKWLWCFSERSVGLIKEVIIKVEKKHMTHCSADRWPIYGVTCSASIKCIIDFSWITTIAKSMKVEENMN